VQARDRRIEITVRGEVDPAPVTGPEAPDDEQHAQPACSGPDGTARLAWSYVPPQDQALEFTGAVDSEGHLYATECPRFWDTSEDGPIELRTCNVLSLDRDGHPRYRRPLPGNQYVHVDLIAGDRLYGTFERTTPRVTSLAAADGQVLWTTPLSPLLDAGCKWAYVSAPVLAGPHLVVAVHALGENVTCNALVALNADTGTLAWKVNAGSSFTQPIADPQGNLYTATYDWAQDHSELLSYTAAGALRWQAGRTGERAPAALNGGILTLSSDELADPGTGAYRATLAIAGIPRRHAEGELPFGPYPYRDVALSAGGLLVVPDSRCTGAGCPTAPHVSERFLYGLDTSHGTLRWTLPIGGYPSAPLLTARNSLLLVDRPVPEDCEFGCQGADSSFDSYLHEFTLDGHEQAACRLQGQAPFITPPVLHKGRLILGAWLNWNNDNDATRFLGLHAYELGSPTELAATGWVTEGGGNTRQGRPR
jgi:outer membrane protein assembly factor BamB